MDIPLVPAGICEYPYCSINDGKAKSIIIENIKYRMVGLNLDI
jgi:hypothetical protein